MKSGQFTEAREKKQTASFVTRRWLFFLFQVSPNIIYLNNNYSIG